MVFRAIKFDQAGTAAFAFVPIRPGTYRFTVGDNPIALGLPAGQAKSESRSVGPKVASW